MTQGSDATGSGTQKQLEAARLSPLQQLLHTLPQQGRLEWIGIRPGRRVPVEVLGAVDVDSESGLVGDHFQGKRSRTRQVTLIQAEHLEGVGSMLGRGPIDPSLVRRNLVVRGINLLALKGRQIRIGEVVLQVTGICAPCSYMEEVLGQGGYNAMRGHGGITAQVLQGGRVSVGDPVLALSSDAAVDEDPE